MRPLHAPAALLLALLLSGPLAAAGWDGRLERLRFDIRWLFIPAGTAIIQTRTGAAPDEVRLRIEACSNRLLDTFYPVRDQVLAEARLTPAGLQPRRYRYRQREGSHHSDLQIDFEAGGRLVYRDLENNETLAFEVPAGTLDMASALFATRRLPLQVGDRYRLPVFDRKQAYSLEIEVLRREALDTMLGDATPTLVIHPRLQSEGIFKRTGEIFIWLTDDAAHIPVRMQSKVRIGSVISELRAIERQSAEAAGDSGLLCERPGKGHSPKRREAPDHAG
ncbi:DUF3108 domain-containing protein [Thiohalobacter sp. IOR34]|uniref:DUF3108 domain-containing protein n=1 Tax=Thiohalobacter sp. IOR34 TaxID=3057176 RepID=UPI0025AF7EEC|nr:DUF3108 domain-containing protein [Thiohalobacter sp. IOR34]WJW74542.1 DUF3108 domain-containing protein [Thiohalobacter sp. IOR34]